MCRWPNVIFLGSSLVYSEIDVLAVRVLAVECIMCYLDFSKVVDLEILTLVARRHLLIIRKNLLVGRECVLASISILAIKWQHYRDLCFQLERFLLPLSHIDLRLLEFPEVNQFFEFSRSKNLIAHFNISIVAHVELKLDVGYFFTTQAVVTIDSQLDFFTQRVTCFVKSYQKRTGLLFLAEQPALYNLRYSPLRVVRQRRQYMFFKKHSLSAAQRNIAVSSDQITIQKVFEFEFVVAIREKEAWVKV